MNVSSAGGPSATPRGSSSTAPPGPPQLVCSLALSLLVCPSERCEHRLHPDGPLTLAGSSKCTSKQSQRQCNIPLAGHSEGARRGSEHFTHLISELCHGPGTRAPSLTSISSMRKWRFTSSATCPESPAGPGSASAGEAWGRGVQGRAWAGPNESSVLVLLGEVRPRIASVCLRGGATLCHQGAGWKGPWAGNRALSECESLVWLRRAVVPLTHFIPSASQQKGEC